MNKYKSIIYMGENYVLYYIENTCFDLQLQGNKNIRTAKISKGSKVFTAL